MKPRSSHLDSRGQVRMVDTSAKAPSPRRARARGAVHMSAAALQALRDGTSLKGDVLAVARLAGIAAAKQTAQLIPLCHILPLDHVAVDLQLDAADSRVHIESDVRCRAPTGAEMEALLAVLVAAATVYDMCKGVDRGMRIEDVELVEKSGGRSGTWRRGAARRVPGGKSRAKGLR